MITCTMQVYQPMFSAKTRQGEYNNEETIEDVMYMALREDERARHEQVVNETEAYYKALALEA